MRAYRPTSRGFTLIELMITLAIMVMLVLLVLPGLGNAILAAKTSVLVNTLPQDVAWARNEAATTQRPVQLILGPGNCQWQTQIGTYTTSSSTGVTWNATAADTTATAAHSMTTAATQYPSAVCTYGGGAQTIAFDSRGLISNGVAPTIVIDDGAGQKWTLQVLLSGLVLLNAATSS